MTFTTTGHVDIVSPESTGEGRDWEVGAAIGVAIVATFVYIYINANFTTMMIRLNSRLEQYRSQLAGLDAYLTRNKVSRDVRKRVKRHFTRSHSGANSSTEKALLESMPQSLQREVLQDIHMRTLRRVPTFFRLEAAALAQVCALVRRVTYLGEERVATQGDVIQEIYFLEEGCILHSQVANVDAGSDSESVDGERTTAPTRGVSVIGDMQTERVTKLLQHRGTPMCEVRGERAFDPS